MTLDDFMPYILPHAKGCSALLATQKLRLAIIELCRRSLIWRETQNTVNSVLNQTAYAYGVPGGASGHQVMKLLNCYVNGAEIEVVEADKAKRLNDAGSVCSYAYGTLAGFEIRPAPGAANIPIVTYGAVAPSLAATTVPDGLGRYIEGIAKGALFRLHSTPDLECTDATAAGDALRQWERCIADATCDAIQGFARTAPRVAPSWF